MRESNSKQNGRSVIDGQKLQESFKIFAQVNSKLIEVINGVDVGFEPKGMPGRMCNIVH